MTSVAAVEADADRVTRGAIHHEQVAVGRKERARRIADRTVAQALVTEARPARAHARPRNGAWLGRALLAARRQGQQHSEHKAHHLEAI